MISNGLSIAFIMLMTYKSISKDVKRLYSVDENEYVIVNKLVAKKKGNYNTTALDKDWIKNVIKK